MSGPWQQPAMEPALASGGGEAGEQPTASAATAACEQQQAEEAGRRESEELNPVSLTDLFARDPECTAKHKERAQASRSMQFAGSQLDHEVELRKLQVFVRIRPTLTAGPPHPAATQQQQGRHPCWQPENCVHATSKYSIAIAPPEGSQAYKSGDRGQTYSFSHVFDPDTSQHEYYEQTAAPLVRDLLRNKQHNSVMMAYGITAAGKTYTIEGTKEAPGVIPRALVELFEGLASHVEPITARALYYEVYNEQIYDLLDEQGMGILGQRAALRLKEDTMGRVFVAGLSEAQVGSADEALALLRRGSRQRQRAETGLNYSSSRSHSIFTVTLYQQGLEEEASEGADSSANGDDEAGGGGEEKLGHISFVDLAGSERAQRTGNVGVRLKESVAINSSLMTLGRCLEALRWNQKHKDNSNLRVVPYRESKVTHLFRDALHGWGQVVLSVNVSPVSRDYDETVHVLKYAALATQIGTIQQVEAPRRTIKAVSPAIKKVKRKAALPAEARGGQGGKAKRAKKVEAAVPVAAAPVQRQTVLATIPEAAEPAVEGSMEPECFKFSELAVPEGGSSGQLEEQPGEAGGEDGSLQVVDEKCDLDAVPVEDSELDVEFGTPSTPLADEDEATAVLQVQMQQLIADLQKAEERCVLLEAEVREEVADEMAQLLRDMEESYRQRMEAEVDALERKHAVAATETGRPGKARQGKAAQGDASTDASTQLLAVARDEAARRATEAEQLREQAVSTALVLEGAQQRLAELQARIDELQAEADQWQMQAEQQQAQAAERAAVLEAETAAVQQLATKTQELLAAEHARAAGLEAKLLVVQQQADDVQASLAVEQQRVNALEAELAAARQQAAEAHCGLEAAQQQAAAREADLAALRDAADSSQQHASEQYEAQLHEAVTQIEANRGMELEMAEEQGERLRKENLALQRRLQAAMAALAAYGSPLAGPGGLAARMAQAAPEGNGRGAGGTPHDVALARARQAAAADDLATAAGAGGSTLPSNRSRFAGAAEGAGTVDMAEEHTAAVVAPAAHQPAPEGEEAEPQREQQEAAKAGRQQRGRTKKTVGFVAPLQPQEELELEAAALQQAEWQQAPPAAVAPATAESKRLRRMTRAAAAAVPSFDNEPSVVDPAPLGARLALAAVEPTAAAGEPNRPQRGRRRTHAAPASAQQADELHPVSGPLAGQAEAQCQPLLAGSGPAVPPGGLEDDDVPRTASVTFVKAPAAVEAPIAPAAAVAKVVVAQARRRGRPPSNKENSSRLAAQTQAPQAGGRPSAAVDEHVAGCGRRRKRLLPSAPMSQEMRAALGELHDSMSLQQHVVQKQAAAGGSVPEAGGKRSRRQTQFFRL